MRAVLDIRIGTMIRANAPDPAAYARQIVGLGFESIEPFFWQTMNKDLPLLAKQLREAIGDADVTIDTLGMFGNPLEDGDLDRQTLAGWEALIDNAHHFGARTIAVATASTSAEGWATRAAGAVFSLRISIGKGPGASRASMSARQAPPLPQAKKVVPAPP